MVSTENMGVWGKVLLRRAWGLEDGWLHDAVVARVRCEQHLSLHRCAYCRRVANVRSAASTTRRSNRCALSMLLLHGWCPAGWATHTVAAHAPCTKPEKLHTLLRDA